MEDYPEFKTSIRSFYLIAFNYIMRTLLWSILAGLGGAIFTVSFNMADKGFLFGMFGFILFRIIILFTIKLMEVKKIRVGIKDKNIIMQAGLLSTNSTRLPVEKIDSISFNQSFSMKLFGVGCLAIISREVTTVSPPIDKGMAKSIIDEFTKLKKHISL